MERIITDIDEKIKVGVLPIETGREAEKKGELKLLTLMLGYTPIISHNSDGKPFIEGYNISISHTKGYVAIIISRFFEVGVDIEYPADRVLRIASRFLRDDEPFNDIDSCLTAWCAKEAVYKLFSSDHLGFHDMKVDVFARKVKVLKHGLIVKFVRKKSTNFLLTYCWR